ncbi:uncharacterized protein LOC141575549 [Camelus bactrianus]|uniref:Uncharacterized protein LOC141575549 n=1 Tax=Camelus bactrianus TaxID=9837 RepID=A0AC58PM26_CAMBA
MKKSRQSPESCIRDPWVGPSQEDHQQKLRERKEVVEPIPTALSPPDYVLQLKMITELVKVLSLLIPKVHFLPSPSHFIKAILGSQVSAETFLKGKRTLSAPALRTAAAGSPQFRPESLPRQVRGNLPEAVAARLRRRDGGGEGVCAHALRPPPPFPPPRPPPPPLSPPLPPAAAASPAASPPHCFPRRCFPPPAAAAAAASPPAAAAAAAASPAAPPAAAASPAAAATRSFRRQIQRENGARMQHRQGNWVRGVGFTQNALVLVLRHLSIGHHQRSTFHKLGHRQDAETPLAPRADPSGLSPGSPPQADSGRGSLEKQREKTSEKVLVRPGHLAWSPSTPAAVSFRAGGVRGPLLQTLNKDKRNLHGGCSQLPWNCLCQQISRTFILCYFHSH